MADRDPRNDWKYVSVVRAGSVRIGDAVDVYGQLAAAPGGALVDGNTLGVRVLKVRRWDGKVRFTLADGRRVSLLRDALVFRVNRLDIESSNML